MRCLEFYSGIGGFAAAARRLGWDVVQAIDINQAAAEVYRHNFPHPVAVRAIDSLRACQLAAHDADLWWLSPPCQPFTVRGQRRDLRDPRAASLLRLLDLVRELRPPRLAMENVPGFASSRAADRLRVTLDETGYSWREWLLCPTELGIPNRRARYYLAGALSGDPGTMTSKPVKVTIADILDKTPRSSLQLSDELLRRYGTAMHIVAADDPHAVANCFTSAYGRSHVRSGSYVGTHDRVRHFSPPEILRLLGFPAEFRLPETLGRAAAWKLVGNSLSIPVVEQLLRCLPTTSD